MSAPAAVDRFLDRFTAFGAEPSVARYVALFHPDATLFDSGMPRPLRAAEIPEHIEGILRLVPGFRMTPERWRLREPTIFVEATNRAVLAGAPIEWASVYCIDLRGDEVIRGRRYYDRRPLLARLSPALAPPPSLEDRLATDAHALPAEPPVAASLRRVLDDARFQLLTEAGDATLHFREWAVEASLRGAPLRFGVATRFDLAGGCAKAARSYLDTTPLG